MASTEAGRRLTEGHRRRQVAIGAETTRMMLGLWQLLNAEGPLDIDEWTDAVGILLTRQHAVSAATARSYYRAFRQAELGEFPLRLPTGEVVYRNQAVKASLIATGPARIRQGLRRGLPIDEAARRANIASAREAMRIALDGGREELRQSVRSDSRALGWARVGSGRPCAFCAMLIGRGPVYRSEMTSRFQSHASCGCTAEPVFTRDQPWPPGAREIRTLYDEATRGERDLLNAFRRAYEGRDDAP